MGIDMANGKRISAGNSIPHTPGSALTAGDVVVQVDLVGVATEDIAASELGALAVTGIFELPKESGVAHAVGDILYWDDSGNELTKTASGNKAFGKCVEAAASGATTSRALLLQ